MHNQVVLQQTIQDQHSKAILVVLEHLVMEVLDQVVVAVVLVLLEKMQIQMQILLQDPVA
jgi:hypothetical protein